MGRNEKLNNEEDGGGKLSYGRQAGKETERGMMESDGKHRGRREREEEKERRRGALLVHFPYL